jgi:hypothetical protein
MSLATPAWEARYLRYYELFLAAAKAALPQEDVTSVQIAFHYPKDTQFLQDLPRGCVRVEIWHQ